MRRALVAVVALLDVHAVPVAAQELKSDEDKTLYALGVALAGQLAPFALSPAEVDLVKAGLTDAALNRPHKAEPREDIEVDARGLVHAPAGPGLGAAIDFELSERRKTAVLT